MSHNNSTTAAYTTSKEVDHRSPIFFDLAIAVKDMGPHAPMTRMATIFLSC